MIFGRREPEPKPELPADYREQLQDKVICWGELKKTDLLAVAYVNDVQNVLFETIMPAVKSGDIPAYTRKATQPEFTDPMSLTHRHRPFGDVFISGADLLDVIDRLNDTETKSVGEYRNMVPHLYEELVAAVLDCNDYAPSVENGKLVQFNEKLDFTPPQKRYTPRPK